MIKKAKVKGSKVVAQVMSHFYQGLLWKQSINEIPINTDAMQALSPLIIVHQSSFSTLEIYQEVVMPQALSFYLK